MGLRRKSIYKAATYDWDVIGAIITLAFVLEQEANNLKQNVPDLPASEVGKTTTNDENVKSYQVLLAIATLLNELMKEGR